MEGQEWTLEAEDSGTKRWEEEEEDKHNESRISTPKCLMTQEGTEVEEEKENQRKKQNKTKSN